MALTTLDPKTALVLIGLQYGIEVHENAVERIFPQIGQRANTAEILELLSSWSRH